MRDGFVFYRSFWEAIKELDETTQAKCVRAISEYALDGIEPEDTGIVKTVFKLVKPQIDANNKRFDNGMKGGRPRNEKTAGILGEGNEAVTEIEPKENQTETKPKPNHNHIITEVEPKDKDKFKEKEKEKEKDKEQENGAKAPKKKNLQFFPTDERLNETFLQFIEMRKKIRAPMTDSAIEIILKKLDNLSRGDPDMKIRILEQSIEHSWRGVFELKKATSNGTIKNDAYWEAL